MKKDISDMERKILVVDDEESVRFTLEAALKDGYTVFTASDGAAAMEVMKREKPALIFLDINMPGVSGMETLGLIKEAGLSPIIWMLTGIEELDTVFRTLDNGAKGYLTKPLELERIRNIVMDVFGETGSTDKSWEVKKLEPQRPD